MTQIADFCLGLSLVMLSLITQSANSTEVASYGTKVPYEGAWLASHLRMALGDAFQGKSLIDRKKSEFQTG
jgi:hypothetical protein